SRLDMAIGIRADPDVGPCRRDCERVQALADRRIANAAAVRQVIDPAAPGPAARDAVGGVADVAQTGTARRRPVLAQSALMPALRISRVHLSRSLASSTSASGPAMRSGRTPRFSSAADIAGVATVFANASRNRAST